MVRYANVTPNVRPLDGTVVSAHIVPAAQRGPCAGASGGRSLEEENHVQQEARLDRPGCHSALTLAACGGEGAGSGSGDDGGGAAEDLSIGVSMPTQTSERWIADGDAVKAQLEEKGYKVDLQFADDDIPTQSQQVDQMITQGADALIIAAIDGTALSSQLQAAADEGIPVIAYDRLIRDSENVDFYVSFDNFKVGVAQANALLTGLGLANDDGPTARRPGRSTSSCSPARWTTTTRSSSSTARWRSSSRRSTTARSS